MSLPTPVVICSFKTYPGTAGYDGVELARELSAGAAGSDASLAVAPQTPDVRLLASETDLPIVAQAADAAAAGAGTGDVLVETLSTAGADALFVSHPEREQSIAAVRELLVRCADVDVDAVVCVRSPEEGRAAIALGARWLLFERPEDVATDDPLVRRRPERVRAFVEAVRAERGDVAVAVGGGMSRASDVESAFALGADAVGAASAVVTAENPGERLAELLDADAPDRDA